jgi:hypothetical protein
MANKKIGRDDLIKMATELGEGEAVRLEFNDFDRAAREVPYLAEPHRYFLQVLQDRRINDSQAIKHAADILGRQLEIILQKRNAAPKRPGPFSKKIDLVAKLDPPALDERTIQQLRELNRIYIHFHDGTLQSFGGDDEVIACIGRLITPAPGMELEALRSWWSCDGCCAIGSGGRSFTKQAVARTTQDRPARLENRARHAASANVR